MPDMRTGTKAVVILSDNLSQYVMPLLPKDAHFIRLGRGETIATLSKKVYDLNPFDILLVLGDEARRIYKMTDAHNKNPGRWARIIECPMPDADWTPGMLAFAGRMIREGSIDYELSIRDGHLSAHRLIPF